jgi:HNH endonuclease
MKIEIPSRLTDPELIAEAKRLARCEREATAQLVAHLAELAARRLYLAAGFPSLFIYCREVLELSEQSTYNRIEAARAARRFPVILDMLSEAALTLATVRLLAPHLTADNHQELLKAASCRSKREVEQLLARCFPQPDVPDSVRKVRAAMPASPAVPRESGEPQLLVATGAVVNQAVMESHALSVASSAANPLVPGPMPKPLAPGSTPVPFVPGPTPRQAVRPLAEDRYEVRFTAPASTCEKLKLAQDLLRHAVPTGDIAEVVDRALTALLENLAKTKFAATSHPRPGPGSGPGAGSRHIPADVRRKVWLRDQGRCSFTSTAGRRCGTRGFLEFHHVQPYAAGGQATADNIQLRCRAHNGYEADLYFGRRGEGCESIIRESAATYGSILTDLRLAPGQVRQMS